MNILEAFKELHYGKKIRRKNREHDAYYYLDAEDNIECSYGNYCKECEFDICLFVSLDSVISEDWEIVE